MCNKTMMTGIAKVILYIGKPPIEPNIGHATKANKFKKIDIVNSKPPKIIQTKNNNNKTGIIFPFVQFLFLFNQPTLNQPD